jgi:hypothetical protein
MGKKIPTYKISIDDKYAEEGQDLGISMIAYTDDPAIMVKGVYMDAKPFLFKDELQMIVAAPAMIPDLAIYRFDNEQGEYYVEFDEETIEKMSKKFLITQSKNSFNLDHNKDKRTPSTILWNWITGDPETDISFTKYGVKVPKGSWFVVSQFHDKTYFEEEIIKKDRIGYSVEGIMGMELNNLINNKLNKKEEKMSKTKKVKFFTKMLVSNRKFNKTLKKFEEIVTEADEVLIVEELKEGVAVEIVDENGEVTVAKDGTYLIPTEEVQVIVEDGVIADITEDKTEEVVEEEMEVTEEVETIETEMAVEEEVIEEVVEEVKPIEIDETKIMEIVQPKLDELYQVIADLKTMVETSKIEEPAGEKQEMSKFERIDFLVKKLKEKQK